MTKNLITLRNRAFVPIRFMSLVVATFLLAFAIPTAAVAADRPTYKIGFIVSLTGPLAVFGSAIRNGVTYALEERGIGKKVFEPIYEDSKYDSKTAVANFRKLSSIDKVNAIYVFGGPMSETLAPMAEREKLPMFSTEYDVRYTKGKKYVVRFANNASDYARVLLDELHERKLHHFALIKVENQYHNTLSEAFAEILPKGDFSSFVANFTPGENDFRTAVTRILNEKPEALGVYLLPGMQLDFLKQLKVQGGRVQLFGTDSFESREENRGLEMITNGAIFANSSVSPEFAEKYRSRFVDDSQLVHAALAYEFAKIVISKFESDSSPVPPTDFMKRFDFSEGRPSVCGEYFSKNSPSTGHYFSFPIAVREVMDGESKILRVVPAP